MSGRVANRMMRAKRLRARRPRVVRIRLTADPEILARYLRGAR